MSMTRPMTGEEANRLVARAQDLCLALMAEGELQDMAVPDAYAMTVLIHAAAMQAAWCVGPNAARQRFLEAQNIAREQLAGAMSLYAKQLREAQALAAGGVN